MDNGSDFYLRPASQSDASTIRQIISMVRINPTALDWKRFILAVDPSGMVIGCGQIKPHSDGSSELASIAVLPGWRGRGIARKIIEYLLDHHQGRLYLTCRSSLGAMYQKFGFQVIPPAVPARSTTQEFRRLRQVGLAGWQRSRLVAAQAPPRAR
jgi:N-acetylglutamate synthase-like GNAT family acetyltransferase